jgi:DNA-directed RNA polymerase specialized sigma24 family protein
MMTDRASVAELTRLCREQTNRFVRGEPRDDSYCYALFARALAEQEPLAWAAIIAQYRGIVLAHVRQHPAAQQSGEDEDFWVNRTFQRFWMAVGGERFARFGNLPSLLKYLKMCAHSVLLDEVRTRRAGQLTPLDLVPPDAATVADAADEAVGTLAESELWATVERALAEDSERLVAYLSLARDLKPSEIHARHKDRYASVAEVYRIKRNVLERLRRSPEIREFLAR